MWKVLVIIATLAVLCIGCQPNTEPIERTAQKGFDVVNATLAKAITETSTRTASVQGNLTGVEPGWVLEGYGIFGTGIVYQGKVYMKGVSGTLMGHSQTDSGEALPDTRPSGDRAPATPSLKPSASSQLK
jgi:hypothetical protein